MGWRLRVLTGRLRDQAAVVATVTLVALVATTLLGTFALLLDGASHDALDEALHRADEEDVRIDAVVRVNGGDVGSVLATAHDTLGRVLGALDADEQVWLTGGLHWLPGLAREDRMAPLAYAADYPAAPEHVELVAGAWPDRARDDAGRLLVAVPAVAAEEYGWAVGTEIAAGAGPREGPDTWVVAGVHALVGPPGTWDRDRLGGRMHDPRHPVPGGGGVVTTDGWGPMLVAPGALTATGAVETVQTTVVPRLSGAPRGAVAALRAAVDDAQLAMTSALDATPANARVSTVVHRTIDATWRELAVTRVAVVVVGLLLGVLAATVMLLAAGLLGERRATESLLLVSRGAAARQLRSLAALEAAALAAGTTLVAPWLALGTYGWLVSRGLLGPAGFRVPAVPPLAAVATCAVVAAVLAVAVVLPQWRTAASTRAGRARLARAGADLALVVVAAVALWQLLSYGGPLPGGVPRVDPVLAVAPALVAVGGAVLALRLVRPVGAAADALARRSRSLVGPVAAWQVARRPATASGAVLVLAVAVGCATFAQSFQATWRTSQVEQVDLAVAADVRVDDLGGDGVASARTVDDVLAAHPGAVAVPVLDRTAMIGAAVSAGDDVTASGRDAHLVAVDTTRPELLRGRTDVPWADVLADLAPPPPPAEDDPSLTAPVPLPGDPRWIVLDVTPTATLPATGQVFLSFALRDARGVHAWTHATLPALDAPLEVAMGVPALALPVELVGVTARVVVEEPAAPPGGGYSEDEVHLALTSVRAVDRAQDADWLDAGTVPSTPVAIGAVRWGGTATTALDDAPLRLRPQAPDATTIGGRVDLTGTWSDAGGTLAATAWEPARGVPAVLARPLADELALGTGDAVVLRVGETRVRALVARVVPHLPGTPRGTDVLVDSGSLARALADAGSISQQVDGWWVAAPRVGDARAVGADLVAAAAGEVTVRADAAAAATRGPLRVAVPVALVLVTLASGVLVLVGMGASAGVALRGRRLELARLQALGADRRALVRALVLENALLVGLGAAAGLAVGALLGHVVGPVLTTSPEGRRPLPPPRVVWDWLAQGGLVSALAVGACVTVAVVGTLLVRRTTGALLRLGDDR
ncbi:FtsX-like permease family protein [Cellulomonas shaoxiangyii]|uniref:FtsX-like permease family protein n=1 Tax=Cellulomonas shaoxiangyii TaxID=2566013 RepID=A0A4P7SKI1_9CELL|nr:FtsX-like permease family protein [Cellulomonas shaoxiangyii]QCB94371.1 FtsX-like permease family protein [Cellulomonas shaoxiangyii]TGY85210.1 FtsX-like permease family protein [Cellulomonas shaoxiangyii]